MNKKIIKYLKNSISEKGNYCYSLPVETTKAVIKEITRLNNKYNKALELLADFNMPCEYDEGKIPESYCEEKCEANDDIYKKCWNKYIELELKEEGNKDV